MSRPVILLSSCAIACATLAAQDEVPSPYVTFPVVRADVDLDGPQGALRFGAIAVGNFDGDHAPDAFVLRGGTLLYVNDMAIDALTTVVGTGFTDIATLKGPPGSGDRCVSIGANGLQLWWYDESAAFTNPNNASSITFTSPSGTGGLGVNAVAVRCADLNSDGLDDILALSADRLEVGRVLTVSATPWTFSSLSYRELLQPSSSLSSVDFDSTTPRQIAFTQTTEVRTFTPLNNSNPTYLCPFYPVDYTFLTNYRRSDGTERLVAMTDAVPNYGQWICVANQNSVESTIWLHESVGAVSVEPLDIDLDNDQDLAINTTSSPNILVLLQDTAGTFSVSTLGRFWIVSAGDNLGQLNLQSAARIGTIDLEGDGDPDLVFGDDPTSSVTLMRNPHRNSDNYQPFFIDLLLLEKNFTNQLQVGLQICRGANFDPDWNHIEIIVYHQPSPSDSVNPDAIIHQLTPVPFATNPTTPIIAPFTLPETATPFPDFYYLVARFVDLNGNTVEEAGPPFIAKLDLSEVVMSEMNKDAGHPILTPGVIPLPSAKGVFNKPTAKGPATTVNPVQ